MRMRLVHVVPRAFGFPELRSYGCRACNEAITLEVERSVQSRTPDVVPPSRWQN
jgi:hypothetical protein